MKTENIKIKLEGSWKYGNKQKKKKQSIIYTYIPLGHRLT